MPFAVTRLARRSEAKAGGAGVQADTTARRTHRDREILEFELEDGPAADRGIAIPHNC
jgi:hypothetical protein